MPFSDALTTVTTAAAAACRVGERKGRIAVGYDADLLIARGDPEENAADLLIVDRVYRIGLWVR